MNNLPHPIQYQGSKRNIASDILTYFPPDINCLIEPFAGSAAISIAAASKKLAKKYIINDLNVALSDLLKIIIDYPEEISSFYESIWLEQQDNSIPHYYLIRDNFNKTKDPKLFLYLLARCVKGAVRYNSDGQFNQSPDNRRKGTRPETMRRNITGVSHLLKGKTSIYHIDYKEILKLANTQDLVYMDPPYQGVCGDRDQRYFSGVNHREFIEALAELNRKKIAYIVSYDGRRGDKSFGEILPESLDLKRIEIVAGKSTQSTLLGRAEITVESLYLSRYLLDRIGISPVAGKQPPKQFTLFEVQTVYEQTPERSTPRAS